MGYDLHISRGTGWSDNSDGEISLEEWNRYVDSDPEIEEDTSVYGHHYLWSGESELESPWLAWESGNIFAKYPDRALLGKMIEIANSLGARVLGDDGEEYRSINDHPDPVEFDTQDYDLKNQWWPLKLLQILVLFVREFGEGIWKSIKGPTFRYVVLPFWLFSALIIWWLEF